MIKSYRSIRKHGVFAWNIARKGGKGKKNSKGWTTIWNEKRQKSVLSV